jgi:signal transduction histidine kinase
MQRSACLVQCALAALIGLLAGLAAPVAAQETTNGQSATIAEVNRILSDPAHTTARRLIFRGVVTFVSRAGDICLQEGRDGVMIEPPSGSARPTLGDSIEATADVGFQSTDTSDPDLYLRTEAIRKIGTAPLPEPEKPWLAEALVGKCSRRRVEVEGIVMQATLERGVVQLHLTDASGWAVVNVHDWREPASLAGWWGAHLRLRGANIGRGHHALRVTSSDEITVVKAGTSELFAAPPADLAALRAATPTPDRLRVEATVLAVDEEAVYLRSATDALRATLLVPYPPPDPPDHPLALIPPAVPEMKAGDRVELVGSPLKVQPWLEMSFASFRPLGRGDIPPATRVTGKELATTAHCDRVRITAVVKGHTQTARGRGQLETLALEADGTPFFATLASEHGGQLSTHRKNDVLDLTGVVVPSDPSQPLVLRLAGPQEIGAPELAVVRRSLPPAAMRTIGLLAGGLTLALAGAWWLQRQVRLRTEALRAEVAVRERTQAELARALAQEREVGELKSRFVTMVSHEFRTPLGITMSAIELLRHHGDKLDESQRTQLFDDIHRSTSGMGGLMEQVLVLGRVEAGRVGCRPVALNLESLAQKLTDESLSATNRRSPIQWIAENDLSGAHADETLLRHIFSNLLSNAVKYSPENTPVIFSCRRAGDDAIFTVQDRGIGIPEADHARLYEAFHRCGNVSDIPGTGLGLVIVKRCVDLHGGRIEFTSTVEKGTTFTVHLPLFRSCSAPSSTTTS